ncbi:MAG: 6-phosphogluconolactonase [Thiolinea sp.]
MKFIEYKDRQQQADYLAVVVADQLRIAREANNKAALAVPGGTTPAPFLQALARQTLDWQSVFITLGDERQVPADHERSNAKLLQENFLRAVPEVNFQPLYREDEDLQHVREALSQHCLPLDVCVLGMGTDGHFASLFPAADQLEAGLDPENTEVLLAITADNIPEPRLSFTLAAILQSTYIHLLITGPEKQQVLEQARRNENTADASITLPIQALLRYAGDRLQVHYAD